MAVFRTSPQGRGLGIVGCVLQPMLIARTDEWYDYRTNPRGEVNVLLTLDEDSYSGGEMGDDHPSAWFHEFSGGRSWYTGGGHTSDSYSEDDFRAHILGGAYSTRSGSTC